MLGTTILIIVVLCLLGYLLARSRMRAAGDDASGGKKGVVALHSLPSYHGAYVALWTGLPSLLLVLFWLVLQGTVIDSLLIASLPDARRRALPPDQLRLLVSDITTGRRRHGVRRAVAGASRRRRWSATPAGAIAGASGRWSRWRAGVALASCCGVAYRPSLAGVPRPQQRRADHQRWS